MPFGSLTQQFQMPLRAFCSVIFLCLFFVAARSQTFLLKGNIRDSSSKTVLTGVGVLLQPLSDTSKSYSSLTNDSGNFQFPALPESTYELRISYLGYENLVKRIRLNKD